MVLQTKEGQSFDRKSLKKVQGRTADFPELASDCVSFANASGGVIAIGIEDDAVAPPAGQHIEPHLSEKIRKRIGELTVNVQVLPELRHHENGSDYILLHIARSPGVASTCDGRYFVRVGDTSRPIIGDDILRLAAERPAFPWESITSLGLSRTDVETTKLRNLVDAIRASERVKASVKGKTDNELLEHYGLTRDGALTNLGVLLLGRTADRGRLGTAPVIQVIKYDEGNVKLQKYSWNDYALSPIELIDTVLDGVPDLQEVYEIPDGLFRKTIPAFEDVVIRELLVNALVHRPYTQRGDIFLNIYPDRLEIVNPGRLPLGVTPQNILHTTIRRNDGLARVFHDLKLMEGEGSGFDMMYDRLLSNGKSAPVVTEGTDSVHVTVPKRIVQPGVISLFEHVDKQFQLGQRERITLAILAQTEGLSAADLSTRLGLTEAEALRNWLGRLIDLGLLKMSGRTRGTRYFVPPALLRNVGLDKLTTLTRMQPHRLRALIIEDVERFPSSSISEIHRRIGPEIPVRALQRQVQALIMDDQLIPFGEKRWRRYQVKASIDQQHRLVNRKT